MVQNQFVVGFIELEENGHIDCTYVKPTHQKQGFASQLLNHVIEVAKDKQLVTLYVEASIIAKPLFEKFKFSVKQENKVIRNGVVLNNYSMHKTL